MTTPKSPSTSKPKLQQQYRVTNAWFLHPVNCPGFFGTATVLDNKRAGLKDLKMKITTLEGWLVFSLNGKMAATNGVITVAIEPIEE